MWSLLKQPRWRIMGLFVLALTLVFVRLGVWQLDRRQERAIQNTVLAARMTAEPVDLEAAVAAAGEDLETVEFRPVTVTGRYRPELEKLVRNRTNRLGTAGFHVLDALELSSGRLVVVNRGWIPLEYDSVPTPFAPPSGTATVAGWARVSDRRPPTGPEDPPGPLDVLNRVDLERIAMIYQEPVVELWVQADGSRAEGVLPQPLELPDTTNPGPHLSYAIQWFSFAVIALIGFLVVVRRSAMPRRRHLPPLD